MKIAYLLLVHANPEHLNRLIRAIDHDGVDFFIHIDKKSQVVFSLPQQQNIHSITNTIPVFWGGFSQVQATLYLLQEAKKTATYDYYILLSGSDYPVRSNTYIHEFLKKNIGKEYLNLSEMPLNNKTLDRLSYVYFEGRQDRFFHASSLLGNALGKLMGIKRRYPKAYTILKKYAGSQWWILSDKTITEILRFVTDHPDFMEFYKHTYIPDEMFFHTIVGNSSVKDMIENACTYADWNPQKKPLPAMITKEHLPILAQDRIATPYGSGTFTPLFARKFSDASEQIVHSIEKTMRK